jgi:hypothetical protein
MPGENPLINRAGDCLGVNATRRVRGMRRVRH